MLHEARALGRQIPWWHQSSYFRLLVLLPKGRTRAKDAPTPGSLGCWQVVESNHTWHGPGTGERQGELHGTFVLRLLQRAEELLLHIHLLTVHSPQVSDGSCDWDLKAWRAFADMQEDSPCSRGLEPISWSYFYRISFLYTHLLHKIELHRSNGYIRKQCHNVCILPH